MAFLVRLAVDLVAGDSTDRRRFPGLAGFRKSPASAVVGPALVGVIEVGVSGKVVALAGPAVDSKGAGTTVSDSAM